MTITNYKDKLIKVQSSYLDSFLANLSGYDSVEVMAKQGCSGVTKSSSVTVSAIQTNKWVANLDEAVKLENIVYQLYVINLFSRKEYNILGTTINLGYVNSNCTGENCTLQTYSSYFAPIFKTLIDAWFVANSIASSVTVSFVQNEVHISNLPAGFGLGYIKYSDEPTTNYKEQVFGYGGVASPLAISDNSLYISPALFGDTTLEDEVYQVTVKLKRVSDNGFITETSCAFIDVTTRCKVGSQLATLSEGEFSETTDNLLLLHYALTVGSNCGCNCPDLCKVYGELLSLIDAVSNTNITTDCGC